MLTRPPKCVRFVKQFCSAVAPKPKAKPKPKRNPSTREALFKFNWENVNLYGPLLKQLPSKHSQVQKTEATLPRIEKNESTKSQPKLTESGIIGKTDLFPLVHINKDKINLNNLANDVFEGADPLLIRTPSVTNILQKTMSPENAAILERWRRRMIAELGEEGFAKYQADLFKNGKDIHQRIYNYLQNIKETELTFSQEISGYWESISKILPQVTNAVALEEKINHPFLHYLGIVDCVAEYQGKTTLIEWKTSQKPKPILGDTYDNPIQVAAYMGAYNFSKEQTSQLQIRHGLIVIAYPDGKPAHAHLMDSQICQRAWNSWLTRLRQFWQFQNNYKREAVIK